jgi:DNA polymerase-3 subunit delta
MKIQSAQINSFLQKIAQEKIAGCLVYGPEESVVKYRCDFIAKKIVTDLTDPFLVTHLGKERLAEDKSILADEFYSISMLGGRKLIWIKDAESQAGQALKTLCSENDFHKNSDNFILIQAGDLEKNSPLRKIAEAEPSFAAIACYEDNDQTSRKFIENELQKNRLIFNRSIVDFLLNRFGRNRQIIASEIEKIALFLGDEKQLTEETIEKVTLEQQENSIEEFIANFYSKKFSPAFIQLEKLLNSGSEPIMLIRFLSNYLQKIYHARIQIDSGLRDFESAVKEQRLFFKTEMQFKNHLKILPREFILELLRQLEKLEITIKTGHPDPKILLLSFVQNYNLLNR